MNPELSFGALHGDLSQNFQGFSSWSFIDLAVSFTSVFEQNIASPCCVVLVLSPIHSPFLLTHFPCWKTRGHYAAVTSFQTHARKQKVAAVIADTSLNTVADNLKYSFNLQLCFLFCYCTFQAAVMVIFSPPKQKRSTDYCPSGKICHHISCMSVAPLSSQSYPSLSSSTAWVVGQPVKYLPSRVEVDIHRSILVRVSIIFAVFDLHFIYMCANGRERSQ